MTQPLNQTGRPVWFFFGSSGFMPLLCDTVPRAFNFFRNPFCL